MFTSTNSDRNKLSQWKREKLSLIYITEKNLASRQFTFACSSNRTVFLKNGIHILELFLTVVFFLPQSRRKIWSLSDCNWTRTHYQLVHKQTLNLLAKLAKWLSYVVSTYLYTAFDCMFLSRHVRISEWIQTLFLPKCQGTPCSKQVRDLKFKCLQLDSKPQPLSS